MKEIYENRKPHNFNPYPLIDELKIIQPYIDTKRCFYMQEQFKNLDNLTKIKVTGNSLWIKFIESKQMVVYWNKKHDELLTKNLSDYSYYELKDELDKRPKLPMYDEY